MISRATLFFEPLDVLQFRDHRPFDLGYHTTAESHFPMPSVFLGCVRTALLRLCDAQFGRGDFGLREEWMRRLLGSSTKQGTLALRGPLFARWAEDGKRAEPLFPAPRDIESIRVKKDGQDHRELSVLRPFAPSARRFQGRDGALIKDQVLWTEGDHEKKGKPDLLTVAGAQRYRDTNPGKIVLDVIHQVSSKCVYEHETRVGIVRDDTTLTAEDRMFYMTRPFRLAEGMGFAVDVELPGERENALISELDGMIVPLGGKAHRARIHHLDGPLIPDEMTTQQGEVNKIWLVTPLPLKPDFNAWPADITAAATDRGVPIGGFDMAARAPKPLRKALPAGTVLYVKKGAKAQDALATLAGGTWTDDRCAGYGVALLGKRTEST